MTHSFGSKHAPVEMQNAFHEAMKRIWERQQYRPSARSFLRAFAQRQQEQKPDPGPRMPLRGVIRRAD